MDLRLLPNYEHRVASDGLREIFLDVTERSLYSDPCKNAPPLTPRLQAGNKHANNVNFVHIRFIALSISSLL
jgi:hypothetical protein